MRKLESLSYCMIDAMRPKNSKQVMQSMTHGYRNMELGYELMHTY